MGLFSLFSKEKKQTLDNGLAKSKESVLQKLSRSIVGKSTVDDDVLDNLEEVLVTSDVGVDTTLRPDSEKGGKRQIHRNRRTQPHFAGRNHGAFAREQ